jgi:YidC/Oxa1 family membrane protein insertase
MPACLCWPAGRRQAGEAIAPGLELVKDYGWLTILAKPLYWLLETRLHSMIGNWGWAIMAPGGANQDCLFYWLTAKGYAEHGQDESHQPQDHGNA